mmetsp:Transcript_26791/g.77217  ORF Transcript_26791/g.77217 Transcript_26791/m.77217 type:complete len:202 (-) Transcript_26791:175-780(-)
MWQSACFSSSHAATRSKFSGSATPLSRSIFVTSSTMSSMRSRLPWPNDQHGIINFAGESSPMSGLGARVVVPVPTCGVSGSMSTSSSSSNASPSRHMVSSSSSCQRPSSASDASQTPPASPSRPKAIGEVVRRTSTAVQRACAPRLATSQTWPSLSPRPPSWCPRKMRSPSTEISTCPSSNAISNKRHPNFRSMTLLCQPW